MGKKSDLVDILRNWKNSLLMLINNSVQITKLSHIKPWNFGLCWIVSVVVGFLVFCVPTLAAAVATTVEANNSRSIFNQ